MLCEQRITAGWRMGWKREARNNAEVMPRHPDKLVHRNWRILGILNASLITGGNPMGLSPTTLERFKALASPQDAHLLKVDLADGRTLYGFLRKVDEPVFMIQEVRKQRLDKPLLTGEYEFTLIITLKSSIPLKAVNSFSKIALADMPLMPAAGR